MPSGGGNGRSRHIGRGRHLQTVGSKSRTTGQAARRNAPRPLAEDRHLWEQQNGESDVYYMYLQKYMTAQPVERSVEKIATSLGKSAGWLQQLCTRWSWVERTAEWDREQSKVRLLALRDESVEMGKRQAQHAQVIAQALLAPATALLIKLRDDPSFIHRCLHIPLNAEGRPANAREALDQIAKLMTVIQKCAAVMPLIANYERAARGILNDSAQQEREKHNDAPDDAATSLTRAVLSDPETAAMANDLYSRLAS